MWDLWINNPFNYLLDKKKGKNVIGKPRQLNGSREPGNLLILHMEK